MSALKGAGGSNGNAAPTPEPGPDRGIKMIQPGRSKRAPKRAINGRVRFPWFLLWGHFYLLAHVAVLAFIGPRFAIKPLGGFRAVNRVLSNNDRARLSHVRSDQLLNSNTSRRRKRRRKNKALNHESPLSKIRASGLFLQQPFWSPGLATARASRGT